MSKYIRNNSHYNVRTYATYPGRTYVAKSTYHSDFYDAKREAKKQRNYFSNFADEALFSTEIDRLSGRIKNKLYKKVRR